MVHLNIFWIHRVIIEFIMVRKVSCWIKVFSFYIYCLIQIGRNPYCIDKNYAGVLIIWDRIFGTFEAEKKEEKVAYGLVHPSKSLLSKSFDYSNSKFEFSTQSWNIWSHLCSSIQLSIFDKKILEFKILGRKIFSPVQRPR